MKKKQRIIHSSERKTSLDALDYCTFHLYTLYAFLRGNSFRAISINRPYELCQGVYMLLLCDRYEFKN